MLMASAFALVTPVGMAIGIGVLHRFNGNDPSTLIALGTLDALSAGILVWVGIGMFAFFLLFNSIEARGGGTERKLTMRETNSGNVGAGLDVRWRARRRGRFGDFAGCVGPRGWDGADEFPGEMGLNPMLKEW
jgi:hypothetical protein